MSCRAKRWHQGWGAHRVRLLSAAEGGQPSKGCSARSTQRTFGVPTAAVTADVGWTRAAGAKSGSSVVTDVCSGCPGEGATSCLGWTCDLLCRPGLLLSWAGGFSHSAALLNARGQYVEGRWWHGPHALLPVCVSHIWMLGFVQWWLLPALQGWPDGPGGAAAAGGQRG